MLRKASTVAGADIYQKGLYHNTQVALLVLFPTAFLLSPSVLNYPVDLALGVMIPAHAYFGTKLIIHDYLPPVIEKIAHIILLILVLGMFFGIMKVNLSGEGVTECIKKLWRRNKVQEQ